MLYINHLCIAKSLCRIIFVLSYLIFYIWPPVQADTIIDDSNEFQADRDLYKEAQNLRYTYPDSSLRLLEQSYEYLIQIGDTFNAVHNLFLYTNICGNLAYYKDAYDKLWKGLSLADEANLEPEKAFLYLQIGRYYSYYKKKEKALEYSQISLDLNKRLAAEGKINKGELVRNYYAFCSTYRELNEPFRARTYLDSCFLIFGQGKSAIKKPFLQFESACVENARGNYKDALKIFEALQGWFEENDPTYLILFYSYMADAYFGLNQLEKSESYYKSALDNSEQYNMHIDFSPSVHKKLSELYLKKGNYQSAYQSLKTAEELDESFFDSRSESNRSLLEIEDAFRQGKKVQEELIQQQKLERLEHEKDVWFFRQLIGGVSILFLVIIGFIYFSYIRAKYRVEKEVLRKEKELEIQKANEILEIKNKELVASALKLIEKDEDLSLLKNKIKEAKGSIEARELNQLLRSISISNDRNWKEFESRFIAVNESFYKKLKKKFPHLTQRDLKLCALIKLNFSSKKMAKLLGISIESTHTSRHRLRKKLNLTRNINLTEFMALQ